MCNEPTSCSFKCASSYAISASEASFTGTPASVPGCTCYSIFGSKQPSGAWALEVDGVQSGSFLVKGGCAHVVTLIPEGVLCGASYELSYGSCLDLGSTCSPGTDSGGQPWRFVVTQYYSDSMCTQPAPLVEDSGPGLLTHSTLRTLESGETCTSVASSCLPITDTTLKEIRWKQC